MPLQEGVVLRAGVWEEGARLRLGRSIGCRLGGWVGGGFWAAVDRVLEHDGRTAVQGGTPSCQQALDGAL